ncbi:BEL1-like homeodomain protein 7 [Ziziphus jujuba]|uniref:BEL1-like homeodomain protein 7 n=5 Tax=Ziziphus jujuba TaxID=326968 RepID=A0A6P3ZX10_ZIZJJ|nr:BEL1-like homeodomain protein 7 [Ziziphus jujuba]XP_015884962.3 BEL1-like homeodomain protein 7 [Ziziphus jujuba]XP_015884964.3 BEL1-like homeodomain protein 7 [Ziziphus jujuba]XP_015884965.3 BEL1-like homeodomain protein 7 [Ziziphus jujuba]XP_048332136.2 BEL1-like homeodomain protein 7 [Ziziphus jujuba]XP_048332137.2 BEL1-like homeodomain protein 7 [Ziziphus jujuba]XP_048332138.2 BEL1-like homeodomain protein 7 [Ziziphus jujuba]
MATHLSNLSNPKYDLLTPYPGDEKFASYPKPPFGPGNMMMYLNQASPAGSYSMIMPVGSTSSNNCVDSVEGRNEMMFIPPMGDPGGSSANGDTLAVPRTQLPGSLNGEQNVHYQGLSLSLGTQIPSAVSLPSFPYQCPNPNLSSVLGTCIPMSVNDVLSCKDDQSNPNGELRNVEYLTSGFFGGGHNAIKTEGFYNQLCSVSSKEMNIGQYPFEPSGVAHNILNTKYLKAAQQLLDEVVNVRKALKQPGLNKQGIGSETDGKSNHRSLQISSDPSESSTNSSSELSPAERQELENKKTKLLSMLDELDGRYKQYYHQMQIVVSFFDNVAGPGAAEPYTALALRTISCHFRCLRDAISGQIQVIQKSLGEQGTPANGQGGAIPRLRYVDQQLRQQKAVQQLGIMRNAWRPQRGLPESSVSILRAWLFEHFLHPYPKDSEKLMLARQTGLTKNQVANWFINARVRLWKPMVEEMYKEEFTDAELNSKLLAENALNEARESQRTGTNIDMDQVQDRKAELSGPTGRIAVQNDSFHEGNTRDSGMPKLQGDHSQKNLYNMDETFRISQNGDRNLMANPATYDVSELGNFAVGNQVSLSLELRHCESDGFSTSGGSHVRGNDAAAATASLDYHCVDAGQQQCRFSNPHLLHDFVV